jgi:hypothetical protein
VQGELRDWIMKRNMTRIVSAGAVLLAAAAVAECYFADYNDCLSGTTSYAVCPTHGGFTAPITDHGIHSYVYPSGDPNQGISGYSNGELCYGATAGPCPMCQNWGTATPPGSKNQWTSGQCCPVEE